MNSSSPESTTWSTLSFNEWADTAETLHLWTQVVGKVRMEQSPWQNHSWHVTLYLTPRGLTTGPIPHGGKTFSLSFDFVDHELQLDTCDGLRDALPLAPMTTKQFYDQVMGMLERAGRPVAINTTPNEIADAIPFDQDETHASYDPEFVHRWWRILYRADRLFTAFRSEYWGKASPSHFFWGSFDLAVTRFSGRTAPDHPGGLPNMPLWVAQEAYSHELSSAGFWPGSREFPEPVFYSYAYPTPQGMAGATVEPPEASWSKDLGEFVLPLSALSDAGDGAEGDQRLMAFLESTFTVAADLATWEMPVRRHFPGE